jgi:predicted RNA binding protein YcfA (HicA-like mRNA interferase family)
MPKLAPIKRRNLIRYLEQLGFDGPYPGGNHQFMKKGGLKLFIPNPHSGDIGADFLSDF